MTLLVILTCFTWNDAIGGCVQKDSQTLLCRIDRPDVTTHESTYPEIVFKPGDLVNVTAGGCVQTGGIGLTWKRYVDPSPASLYFGSIDIPGATKGMVPLSSIVGQALKIASPGGGGILKLGYADDNYADNGYYSHDNGTGNQCAGVGDAWVELAITRDSHATESVGSASKTEGASASPTISVALVGVIALVIASILAWAMPPDTPSKELIFKILMSFGGACLASSFLMGNITYNAGAIAASGGIAVFLVLYLLNPARLVS